MASGDMGPGTGIKDLLPIPSDTQPISDPAKAETSNTLMEDPSLSHALATDDHEEKGLAQQNHDEEVVDLGWNEKKQDIPTPLVGGMDNEELWMLVRRFNKVRVSVTLLSLDEEALAQTFGIGRLTRPYSKCIMSRRYPIQSPGVST